MIDASLQGPVLVTGASGFLGRHLCQRLVKIGAQVHALRRGPVPGEASEEGGIIWHSGDLTDPIGLRRVLGSCTPAVVFHLAAHGTTFDQADREKSFEVNVRGCLNLWEAIAHSECRVIAAGSCGEYGQLQGKAGEGMACEPTWFYPATKHAGVTLLGALGRESGREVVILRPFGPYGPGDLSSRIVPYVIRRLIAGENVDVTTGEQLRDYTFVDDQIDAFVLAATRPLTETGGTYNIGSGECITLKDLVTAIAQAVSEDALVHVRFGAVPYREGEVRQMCANIDRARRELGYAPSTPLAEGLQRTVAWHRESRGGAPG